MANRLALHKSRAIQSLAAAGHSKRQLAEEVGVSRGAVRRPPVPKRVPGDSLRRSSERAQIM